MKQNTVTDPVEAGLSRKEPEMIQPAEAARMFGVSRSTVFEWLKTGRIKNHAIRTTGNKAGIRLIVTASIRAFIESHPA